LPETPEGMDQSEQPAPSSNTVSPPLLDGRDAGTKTTRHEKLTLTISILALVIAVGSPFLNYYWFQNEVRIQQLKAESFVVRASIYGCPEKKSLMYQLSIRNKGVWPINNVHIIIQRAVSTFDPAHQGKDLTFIFNKKDIDTGPEVPVIVAETGRNFVISLKEPLMPMPFDWDVADYRIHNVPSDTIDVLPDMESLMPDVWVSSDVASPEVGWDFMIDCRWFKNAGLG
jgi:hypothetical protein